MRLAEWSKPSTDYRLADSKKGGAHCCLLTCTTLCHFFNSRKTDVDLKCWASVPDKILMYRKSEAKKSNLLRSGPYICSTYIFINIYNNNNHIGHSDRLSKRVGEGLRRSPWCQYSFDAGVFSYQNMTGGEGQALHSSQ